MTLLSSQGKGGVLQGRLLWHYTVRDLYLEQISFLPLIISSTVDLDFVDFGDAEEKSIGEVSHQSINLDSFTGILHASILNPPPFCALKIHPEKIVLSGLANILCP